MKNQLYERSKYEPTKSIHEQLKAADEWHKQGYILLLTLLMISASVMVVTYMYNRSSTYLPFMQTMVSREKAKLITLSGLQVALAQLSKSTPQKNEEDQKKGEQQKSSVDQEDIRLLTEILPALNRWQEFSLKEESDGITAELKICLMSEDGKFNINEIYDFKKKAFIGGDLGKNIIQGMFKRIEQEMGGKDLFNAFEKFLKERKYKLIDVTELLSLEEFALFKRYQFYEPPTPENSANNTKRPFYLTDIFTVHTKKSTLQPWLFSDSVSGLLSLKRAQPNEVQQRKQMVPEWLKSFKHTTLWMIDWNNQMQPLYERELQSLPKGIESVLFEKIFDPAIFSVLVYGTVESVTQRIFAIVERVKRVQTAGAGYDVKIKKIYWL